MKRDAVITSFLLANACLLIYVAVILTQRPSLPEIDARIEYWHRYFDMELKRLERIRKEKSAEDSPEMEYSSPPKNEGERPASSSAADSPAADGDTADAPSETDSPRKREVS